MKGGAPPMRYHPHDEFADPARPRAEPWRTALGMILIYVAHIGLVLFCFTLLAGVIGEDRAQSAFDGIFFSSQTTAESLLLLGSFSFLILAVSLVTMQLHGRAPSSLTGPPRLALAHFLWVLRALAILFAVLWFLPMDVDLNRNLTPGRWLLLLPLSVTVLLIQATAEEMLFRGYLQQQLAARFRAPAIWMGLPSAIFAWGHFSVDQAGQNAGFAALWAGLFALAAADLTARTGTIGAAVALHFANNAGAILLVSLRGPVSGLSLYTYPFGIDAPQVLPFLIVDLGVLLVSWLAARLALQV